MLMRYYQLVDMTGQRFGRLLVIERNGSDAAGARWLCRCDCGTSKTVGRCALIRGATKSCGCLGREVLANRKRIHGMTGTTTFAIWSSALARCRNPNVAAYKNYGGRGITMCARWASSFENFYADMGERPRGLCLERVDNNCGYEPGNCIWATRTAQSRNTRLTRYVTLCGQRLPIIAACEKFGLSNARLIDRVRRRRLSHVEVFLDMLGQKIDAAGGG